PDGARIDGGGSPFPALPIDRAGSLRGVRRRRAGLVEVMRRLPREFRVFRRRAGALGLGAQRWRDATRRVCSVVVVLELVAVRGVAEVLRVELGSVLDRL